MRLTALTMSLCLVSPPVAADMGKVAPPESSVAAGEAAAKVAYRAGVEHFKGKRFADAIVEFNKAYRIDPNAVLVFNLARCFEELKQYDSAVEFYNKYLVMAQDAPDKVSVEASIRTLELLRKGTAAPLLVSLTFTSKPQGARVYVDGRELGITPLNTQIPAGRHVVVLELDGFVRASNELSFEPSALPPTDYVLVPAPIPVGRAETSSRNTWTYVALGTGAALLAAAGVTGFQAWSKADKLDQIDEAIPDDPEFSRLDEYEALKSDGKTFALVTDGLLLTGTASLVTGLILLLTGDDDHPTAPANAASGGSVLR